MSSRERLLEQMRGALAKICPRDRAHIADIQIFRGANIFSLNPAVAIEIETAHFDLKVSALHRQLTNRFAIYPAEPGDNDETSVGVEQIAACTARLAANLLTMLLEAEALGAVHFEGDGRALFSVECPYPAPAIAALSFALLSVMEFAAGATVDKRRSRADLKQLNMLCARRRPGFQSQVLMTAARHLNIPFLQVGEDRSLWQFGWGRRSECFWEAASNGDGLVSSRTAREKPVTKQIFRELGIPTSKWRRIGPREDFKPAAAAIGYPCAVKPSNGGRGTGVTANISNMAELERAVALARRQHSEILVEAHQAGSDYRLMVIEGRLMAAARRDPPSVVGDGTSTVRELVAAFNRPRQRSLREAGYLVPVADDAPLRATLASQSLSMDSVLAAGKRAMLLSNANRSTGGIAVDVLDQVHPQIRGYAEQLSTAMGLRVAGVDYITPDISRSPSEVGGSFIEINTTPGMTVHLAAGAREEEIGAWVLGDRPGRIPVTLILDEARSTTEMLRYEASSDKSLAVASAKWAQIGNLELDLRTLDPVAAVTAPLRYPQVDALTVIWTLGELYALGLPVNQIDKIIVIGAHPREDWLELLHRVADEVLFVESPAEAVAARILGAK